MKCSLCAGTLPDEAPHIMFKKKPFCVGCLAEIIRLVQEFQNGQYFSSYGRTFVSGVKPEF